MSSEQEDEECDLPTGRQAQGTMRREMDVDKIIKKNKPTTSNAVSLISLDE